MVDTEPEVVGTFAETPMAYRLVSWEGVGKG